MRSQFINFLVLIIASLSINSHGQISVTLPIESDACLYWKSTYPSYADTPYPNFGSIRADDYSSGGEYKLRSLLKFDVTSIPSNAYITEAKLLLFSPTEPTRTHTPVNGSANTFLRIITSSWDENTITWNTFDPSTMTTNNQMVSIPGPTSIHQDYEVDIRNVVQGWVDGSLSNYGMLFSLETEELYQRVFFASSNYATESKHPVLEIEYVLASEHLLGDQSYESAESNDMILTPFGTYYHDGKNEYLFLASELRAAGMKKGNIRAISFDVVSAASEVENFNVHMGQTSIDELTSGNFFTNLTNVYSNNYTPKEGRNAINLDTPFEWDGESNIIVQTCFDNDYYTQNTTIKYSVTNQKSTRGDYADGTTGCGLTNSSSTSVERPNVIFTVEISNEYQPYQIISTYNRYLPTSENYIRTITAKEEGYKTTLSNESNAQLINEDVQYFDGLGRLMQQVSIAASPSGKDIVKPVIYDDFGRIKYDLLPYPADNIDGEKGRYRSSPDWLSLDNEQADFFQEHFNQANPYPYSVTEYDNSPLNRITEQGAPGAEWQPDPNSTNDHSREFFYGSNGFEDVKCFRVNQTTGELENNPVHYSENQLYKNSFYDEDDNLTVEFKDKLGQVVLKRTFDDIDNDGTQDVTYSTYYVYDDFGLLRFVLPPKVDVDTSNLGHISACLNDLCYQYKYDERKRMIEKKLPGADKVYMFYDNRDRLVMTQDGEMRDEDQWLVTAYDELNRPSLTCIWDNESEVLPSYLINNYTDYQNFQVGWDLTNHCYSLSFPWSTGTNIRLTETYYDDYKFINSSDFSSITTFDETNNVALYTDNEDNTHYFERLLNQVTGSKTLVLDGTYNHWISSVNYYDDKYRIIQSQNTVYPTGTSVTSFAYDFTGKTDFSLEVMKVNGIENKILKEFYYDHRDRLTETWIKINDEPKIVLSQMIYNELGELVKKNLHSENTATVAQSIDYEYNIRGWLTAINNPEDMLAENDHFGMDILYQQNDQDINNTGVYNGNISAIKWYRSQDEMLAYSYNYDDLNRLTSANLSSFSSDTWSSTDNYKTAYTYDLNGNIKTLKRYNAQGTLVDNLDYQYTNSENSNQLNHISDLAGNTDIYNNRNLEDCFSYDRNGNLVIEEDKGLEIDYNYLNLPEKITRINYLDNISYIYDASGKKWLKISYEDDGAYDIYNKTMYAGSFVYKMPNGSSEYIIDYLLNSEGLVEFDDNNNLDYKYFIKDHLGNTRVTFSASTGIVDQQADYYPFGLSFADNQGSDNKYLYNGKEIQDDEIGGVNLDWYDYGARYYDPAIARWSSIDPLSESYYSHSPFHFSGNNPINLVDLNGMNYSPIYDQDGNFLGTDDQGLQGQALVMNEEDFEQGMSHEEALDRNLGAEGLTDLDAASKLHDHYNGLKDRPDYDGFVTISEGVEWAKQHPNTLNNNDPNDALYLDASKMNFGNLSVSDMENLGFSNGSEGPINLFNYVTWSSSSSRATTYALGNTQIQLINSQSGTVKLFNDIYDWDYHNYPQSLRDEGKLPGNRRDRLIYRERQRTGLNDSHGFRIIMYGVGTIKTK